MTDLGELSKEATSWRFTETIQALAEAADKAITLDTWKDVCHIHILATSKDVWDGRGRALALAFAIESCMRQVPVIEKK